jgi:hypothetical protein
MRTAVFFGVHEALVDEALDHLAGSGRLPVRCIVVGTNMPLLGALCEQWQCHLELTVVCMPRPSEHMLDATRMLTVDEGLDPRLLVWVHGRGLDFAPMVSAGASVRAGDMGARALVRHPASPIRSTISARHRR